MNEQSQVIHKCLNTRTGRYICTVYDDRIFPKMGKWVKNVYDWLNAGRYKMCLL